jgi:hemerythrin-like domain-containing protein
MVGTALRIIRDEHVALAAMLRSLEMLVVRGRGRDPQRFFDTVRAMLFYIDEFPERRHHPNESALLFPPLVRCAPELLPVIERLEIDHVAGEGKVRELQHLLLGWEILGITRKQAFCDTLHEYVRFYLEHMQVEEKQLLPIAQERFTPDDWAKLDAAFEAALDPLVGGSRDAEYDELFTRIVTRAPAPIGVGED